MAVPALPIWTLPPDWADGVTERLEWGTGVLRSDASAAEQRFSLRIGPRREFDLSFVVSGPDRTRLALMLDAVGRGEWLLPLWHDGARLGAAAAPGASALALDTRWREFAPGGLALLHDGGAAQDAVEAVEVAAVADGGLTLAAPLAAGWSAAWTRVYPLRRARALEGLQMDRRASAAFSGSLRFRLEPPEQIDWLDWSYGASFAGLPVLTVMPDQREDATVEWQRLAAIFDSGLAAAVVSDPSGKTMRVEQHRLWAHGREERAVLRAFLHTLRGRHRRFLLPTFAEDFALAADAADNATMLTCQGCGYFEFGFNRDVPQRLRIERRDGTASHHAIVGAALDAQGRELVGISPPLPAALSRAMCYRLSLMDVARADQDAVELTHHTDADGVMTAALTFRTLPGERNGPDWTPLALTATARSALPCGTPSACGESGVFSEFVVSSRSGADNPGLASVPIPELETWQYAENVWRAARWDANLTPEAAEWIADFWTNHLGAELTSFNTYTKTVQDAPLARETQAEDDGTPQQPPECGWLPLAMAELHSTTSLNPVLPEATWLWRRTLAAFWLAPAGSEGGFRYLHVHRAEPGLPPAGPPSDLIPFVTLPSGAVLRYCYLPSLGVAEAEQEAVPYPIGGPGLLIDPLDWHWMPEPGQQNLCRVRST